MSRTYFCSPDDLATLRSRFPSDRRGRDHIATNWLDIFGIKVYASPFLKDGEGVLATTTEIEFALPKFEPRENERTALEPHWSRFALVRKALAAYPRIIAPDDPLSLTARIRIRKRRMKRERRLAIKAENARRSVRR